MKFDAYWRLMRFHKPVGIGLLWCPTAWALWIANAGRPPFNLLMYFLMGTILMRAAGCIVNDIADKNIDKHVLRTQARPLTTGEVSLTEAFILLFVLLTGALWIVIHLPKVCFLYALISLLLTCIYPFCKRFFPAPQAVLGFAFSMSIPMVYAASFHRPDAVMFVLLLMNWLWIIAYDTMYAMSDREDDLKIGVKSTAILLAEYERAAILVLQMLVHGLWIIIACLSHVSVLFYGVWLFAISILVVQQRLANTLSPKACLRAFNLNVRYGFLMWAALMLATLA